MELMEIERQTTETVCMCDEFETKSRASAEEVLAIILEGRSLDESRNDE